jgi:flagellar biosynthesis/type III secretory pathway protein FliH
LNAIREITEEEQMVDVREKASLDIQSNLIDARQEGREEGRQEGMEIGEQRGDQRGKLKASIQIYEELLSDSVTSESILSSRSAEELESMVANLQKRLRDRTT